MRKLYLSLFVLICASAVSFAQQGKGSIKGKVTDSATGEGVPFCNVLVYLNGNQVNGSTTDFDGNYTIKPIDPGTYEVEFSFVGYTTQRVNGFIVKSNKTNFLDATLSESDGIDLEEAVVIDYAVPLIDKDGGASGGTVTREDLAKMPGRSAASIATTVAGVSSAGTGGELSVRGSRTSGTFYYIDGIKVRGSTNLPKAALEEVSVITGGVPANYGDATGGIISITTRGASSFYFGGLDLLSSGFKSGRTAVGLDRFGYNLVEGFLSGPLLWKKNEDGSKDKPLLGFFLSGNFNHQVDPRPAFDGTPYLRDEVREELLTDPARVNYFNGRPQGFLYNADFIRAEDIEYLPTRQNVGSTRASLSGKIDVTTTPTINLTFGGSGSFLARNNFSYDNMLMNTDNNSYQTAFDWRAYGRFSQRFENDPESTSNVKNIYYTLMVDYSQNTFEISDKRHGEDFFKYGHVGTYDVFRRNSYTISPTGEDANGNTVSNLLPLDGNNQEVYVTFQPSDSNPSASALMNDYFSAFPSEQLNGTALGILLNNPTVAANNYAGSQFDGFSVYGSLNNILQGGGVRNGDEIAETYNLWNYLGTPANVFQKGFDSQIRFTGAGSADIGNHAVQIGFEYEQRRDAFYGLAPVGLWNLARLNTNSHTRQVATAS